MVAQTNLTGSNPGPQAAGPGGDTIVPVQYDEATRAFVMNATELPAAFLGYLPLNQSGIPLVVPSSGSMGNNGALTGITAVLAAYANAYVFLPAGALFTGSPQGFYFAQFSSTTAATVFGNLYPGGQPSIPAVPTPVIATGPGAYTQSTGLVAFFGATIPGGTLGNNGRIELQAEFSNNNSANTKTVQLLFGNQSFGGVSPTTQTFNQINGSVTNRGVPNSQIGMTWHGGTTTAAMADSIMVFKTIDTTQNQTVAVSVNLANAGDTITLEAFSVKVFPN